jgi:3-hydroxyisobutyrate dehydrogenase-like beta-hydroxyacid dehydrogenase
MHLQNITLIGHGEVGGIFAQALQAQGLSVTVFDKKYTTQESAYISLDLATALAKAEFIISAVTADQTKIVATQAAPHLRPGTYYLDLNSASPACKQACAELIETQGAHYVEAAVMTSVPPYGLATPMLLGGPHGAAVVDWMNAHGFAATATGKPLGFVSAVKMCRSVIIKGMEAITVEGFTAARHYGVEEQVLASLRETFPTLDFEQQADYFFQRSAQHGKRRSDEMRESAHTMADAGILGTMAGATADRQAWMAREIRQGTMPDKKAKWRVLADHLLKKN